jgi:putative glutamine amidotransferase
MKPLIGITGRRLLASTITHMDARYADREIDFFFSDYAARVAEAGAIPVLLPYEAGSASTLDRLDGLLVTGGQDVHPSVYGAGAEELAPVDESRTSGFAHDLDRDAYEMTLIRAAIATRTPVLGICRGHQVLNVALGGTLVADLPATQVEHYLTDAAPTDGRADHRVEFTPGSLAHGIYGHSRILNSWHHQAVDRCGAGLVVSGRAHDGVVESIELPDHPVLGVQWHPEWQVTPDPVFAWLVAAAQVDTRSLSA